MRQVIAYCALAAVVLLAAGIILHELRAAGVISSSDGMRHRKGSARSAEVSELGWSAVERAALRDKPRLLLELIIRRMGDRGLLPPAGALTVRELTATARLPEPDDRGRLADLGLTAEQVLYSAQEPESHALDRSVMRGRELLDRLEGDAQG